MVKIAVFCTLFAAYTIYTVTVYTRGTQDTISLRDADTPPIALGKQVYQQYNCTACHQIYGLGGYLGPELTTTYSNPEKGEFLIRGMLKNGGLRMPNLHLSDAEINGLVSYLRYVDSTATSYKHPPYHE